MKYKALERISHREPDHKDGHDYGSYELKKGEIIELFLVNTSFVNNQYQTQVIFTKENDDYSVFRMSLEVFNTFFEKIVK